MSVVRPPIYRETRRRNTQIDGGSRQNLIDHSAMHVGQTEVAALEFVGQAFVVDAQQVQHQCLPSCLTHIFTQLNGSSYLKVFDFRQIAFGPRPRHSTEPFARRDFRTCRFESFLPRIEGPDFRWEVRRVAGDDRQVVEQRCGGQQTINHGPPTALSFVRSR